MPADLLADTAVTLVPGFDRKYAVELPNSWNWRLPSGGVLMTVGMRALREAVGDPAFHPISATSTFCQPVPAGRIEIDVEILRRGNAATRGMIARRAGFRIGPLDRTRLIGGLPLGDVPAGRGSVRQDRRAAHVQRG